MTHKVIITDEAMDLIRAAATLPFKQTAKQLFNGDWELNLADDVYERIQELAFPGESVSDTIIRAVHTLTGRKPQ